MSEQSNVVTVSIINIILATLISMLFIFNNAVASGLDLKNNTNADSLLLNTSQSVEKRLDNVINQTNMTAEDLLPDEEQNPVADIVERIISVARGMGKAIRFLANAAIPYSLLKQALVDTVSNQTLKTIMMIFISTWQLITIGVWIKFIFGYRVPTA